MVQDEGSLSTCPGGTLRLLLLRCISSRSSFDQARHQGRLWSGGDRRAHLIWTEKPFIIETDHKNLTYWKEPKKLSGRTARWHEKLQDYNFKIVHVPGKDNGPADALSRMHQDEEREEPKMTSLLPPDAFLNVFEAGDPGTIEHDVVTAQQKHRKTMEQWEKTIPTTPSTGPHTTEWRDREEIGRAHV